MFNINYQIVRTAVDDFPGQNGFFQIECNGYTYGENYPSDIADKLIPDDLYDWFTRIVDIMLILRQRNYVLLSDIESYNRWIEFVKDNEEIIISIKLSVGWPGSQCIEYSLPNAKPGEWIGQKIPVQQFEHEIISKAEEYVNKLFSLSLNCEEVVLFAQKIKNIKVKYE